MDAHLISYYIGILIVFASHIVMSVTMPSMRAHSIVNIFAALCIAYYFTHREGYIKF